MTTLTRQLTAQTFDPNRKNQEALHGRRFDGRGVLIGPWTAAARRSSALLRAAHPAL